MKKYMFRFLVAILAFCLGTTIIYISVWDSIKTSIPTQIISSKPIVHSAENNSPYSVLEGTTVKIKPYDATFEIPESWITYKPYSGEPKKNLYLSWQDLNELERFDFNHPLSFDKEDAQVMRSALPFENCAAHVGSMSWGNGNWNDLQARIFVTDLKPEEIAARVEKQGLDKASEVFERASVKSGNHGLWEKRTLDLIDAPTHFILGKNLAFYYRSFGAKTVVIVFLHTDRFKKEINLILDSFKWTNGA